MRTVVLDGRRMDSREVFHETVARELEFPGWYGKNLDALYDCLTDLPEETVLSVLHPGAMKEKLGAYGEKILATLLEAQRETSCLSVCLQVEEAE